MNSYSLDKKMFFVKLSVSRLQRYPRERKFPQHPNFAELNPIKNGINLPHMFLIQLWGIYDMLLSVRMGNEQCINIVS